jgi:hypothetical protein
MQANLISTHRSFGRSGRRAAVIAAAIGVTQFAVALSTAQATTYVISAAGASALGSFDRDNSSATNPVSGSFSPGVLALGQAAGGTLQIGNTVYTEPGAGQVLLGSDKTGASQEDPATNDQLLYQFSETGSVFGLQDLTNSNGLSTALNPGATAPNPGNYMKYPIAPNGPLPLWVNGTQFTAQGTQGISPSNTATRYIGTNGTGSFTNSSVFGGGAAVILNGGDQTSSAPGEAPVQVGFSDVEFEQAYAIPGGSSSLTAVPFQPGYGLGKGATINAVTGQPSGTNFQALASSTSIIGGINPTTTYLRDQTVAVEEFNFVANPGTGLGEISKSDAQWLEVTGRFQNGANFNMMTRDIGSGTRNEGALNIGIDPSFAAGERDRISDAQYTTTDYNGNPVTVNVGDEASPLLSLTGSGTLDYNENRAGPDIRFADKISGGSGVRATVVANRMAVGVLGGGDSNSSSGTALAANSGVGNNVNAKPAMRALAIDFGKGNGYTQGTVANISNGLYDLWSNSQAITVAPYADPTLNDGTYTTRPILNDLLEQNNGTQTITTSASTYNNLQNSAPNGPGLVRKFVDNIANSVTTYSSSSSNIAPADYLLTGGYLLPQTIAITKQYDGGTYSTNAGFDQNLYNTYATNGGLEQQYTDWADPNTTNGNLNGSQTYTIYSSDNNAVNGATANLTIPISPRTTLAGDFNNSGVRDNQQVPALALAYADPTAYLNTPASGDPNGLNYNGVQVQSTTQYFPGVGTINYSSKLHNGSAGNTGDGLIVLSDFDGQGNVINNNTASFSVLDGVTRENLLYFLYGCTVDTQDAVGSVYTPGAATIELNGSTESLTAAQNASVNGVRYGHLTKNASIIAFNNTISNFETGVGSIQLSAAQVGTMQVDRFDTALAGVVNRGSLAQLTSLVGQDYTNMTDVQNAKPIVWNFGTNSNPDYVTAPIDPIVASTLIDGTAANPHTTVTAIADTTLPAGQQSDEQELVYHLQGRDVNPSLTGNEVSTTNQLLNGDANLDGTVDIRDLASLRTNFGSTASTLNWTNADFNFDGTVDVRDLNYIKENFGLTAMGNQTYNGIAVSGPNIPQANLNTPAARAVKPSGVATQLKPASLATGPTLTAGKLTLAINTVTGDAQLLGYNPAVTLSSYQIEAPSGSGDTLQTANWNSLQLQGVMASHGGGGWSNLSDTSTNLAEYATNIGSDAYNNVGVYISKNVANPAFDLGDIFTPGQPDSLQFIAEDGASPTAENDAPIQYYTPEPSSLALLGLGSMAMMRRTRRRKA